MWLYPACENWLDKTFDEIQYGFQHLLQIFLSKFYDNDATWNILHFRSSFKIQIQINK